MKLLRAAMLVLLMVPASGWSDSITLGVTAGADLPYDPLGFTNTAFGSLGGSITLSADYSLPFVPVLFLEAVTGVDVMEVKSLPGFPMSVFTAAPGLGLSLRLSPRLQALVSADAGYLLVSYSDIWTYSYFVLASARLLVALNPSFGLGAGAVYKYYPMLYSGVELYLTTSFKVNLEKM
jgi:hypothetical protein